MDKKKTDIIIFSFFSLTAILVLVFVVYLSSWQNIPIASLTRDPLAVTNSPPYFGFLSNMGVIFWSITVGITLITSIVLFSKSDLKFRFFLYSCLFTFLLLADDLFMLHERFYTRLYLPEKTLFGIYGIITMMFILKHIKMILKSYVFLFIISIFFFFLSVVVDQFHKESLEYHYLFEDGSKFFGIVFWMAFFMTSSIKYLTDSKAERIP